MALVAFFASSMLAVHLMSLPGAPDAAAGAPRAAPAIDPVRAPPAVPVVSPAPVVASAPPPAPPAAPEPSPGAVEEGLPPPLYLGVAPVPPPAMSADRERKVNACVERKFRESGGDEVKPTLPGRWPAIKRAREEKRLRRLALRAACEKELGG